MFMGAVPCTPNLSSFTSQRNCSCHVPKGKPVSWTDLWLLVHCNELLLRTHDLQTLYLVCGFSIVVTYYVNIIVNLYIWRVFCFVNIPGKIPVSLKEPLIQSTIQSSGLELYRDSDGSYLVENT